MTGERELHLTDDELAMVATYLLEPGNASGIMQGRHIDEGLEVVRKRRRERREEILGVIDAAKAPGYFSERIEPGSFRRIVRNPPAADLTGKYLAEMNDCGRRQQAVSLAIQAIQHHAADDLLTTAAAIDKFIRDGAS